MTKRRSLSSMLDMIGSAISVAAAVESHSRPKARDLRNLGIDPDRFDMIGR